ncbi:hypothetical protein L7F22_031215 [Adiantum nelumboides]|nr:hypothetical protein [Adiantum nelumboides]
MHLNRNQRNFILAVCAPIPALGFYGAFLAFHSKASAEHLWWEHICTWSCAHPLALLNVLFFFNVSVLFWVISLVQRSTWLIDLYWTVLPVLMAHFFSWHPKSMSDPLRSRVVITLTWIWSARLTHSYFRRENWQWGEREDWRFANMRKENPKHWWWLSFFVTYVSQQTEEMEGREERFALLEKQEAEFTRLQKQVEEMQKALSHPEVQKILFSLEKGKEAEQLESEEIP